MVGGNVTDIGDLQTDVGGLQTDVTDLQDVTQFFSVETSTLNDLTGPHLLITGANVHVRSGSGCTTDSVLPDCLDDDVALTAFSLLRIYVRAEIQGQACAPARPAMDELMAEWAHTAQEEG